ncbi:hypothetical protein [uncultured Mediterranean phage uvMED]|jgi:hypothetical protein|nr:hypothetical protein [uncultured Mediterranean phage uvMED]BAR19749.1 hypothetical protein [uncultured Mediterranean phage uvMED]BAR19816.1 hypothetical protein [uncultured Mediterranean phage uvMED]
MIEKSREDEINEQAEAFSKQNPEVSRLFVKFTHEIIARGFRNYSVQAIFERIRWETDQADVDGKSTFKLNNNYTPWFSRKFMERYPEHDGFFRTRKRISGEQTATNLPELTPDYYERNYE